MKEFENSKKQQLFLNISNAREERAHLSDRFFDLVYFYIAPKQMRLFRFVHVPKHGYKFMLWF